MVELKEGDKAPAFTAKDQDGNKVSLADLKGKRVVLYFYPQDDTPTCTVQACNLRDNYALLKKEGFVLGVSPDDEAKQKFEAKLQLPSPLVSDPETSGNRKSMVWGEKQLYGRKYMGLHRTTFVIDEKELSGRYFCGLRTNSMQKKLYGGMESAVSNVLYR